MIHKNNDGERRIKVASQYFDYIMDGVRKCPPVDVEDLILPVGHPLLPEQDIVEEPRGAVVEHIFSRVGGAQLTRTD